MELIFSYFNCKKMKSAIIEHTLPFAKESRWKSWYYTLSTLCLLITSLLLTLVANNYILKLILGCISGLLNVRMFVIYHDYLHNAILYKSKAADKLFLVYGRYMLAPNNVWSKSHSHHHSTNSYL